MQVLELLSIACLISAFKQPTSGFHAHHAPNPIEFPTAAGFTSADLAHKFPPSKLVMPTEKKIVDTLTLQGRGPQSLISASKGFYVRTIGGMYYFLLPLSSSTH